MRLASVLSLAATAAVAVAKDVACVVDGSTVATVDLDTGSCPFTIPSSLPVIFDFTSADDYNVEFYYAVAQNHRYFNDIVNAGRVINIPAKSLYGTSGSALFQVHAEKNAPSNSTKRFDSYYKRDAASDLAASLESQDGTAVGGHSFEVVDITPSSSITAGPVSTETDTHTLLVTITSCADNKCHETVVPGKETLTTVTIDDVVTSYTTVCPLTESLSLAAVETDVTSTVIITLTSCVGGVCSTSEAPASEMTTVTVYDETTSYTTVCPLSEATQYVTEVVTVTSCNGNKCAKTVVPSTKAPATAAPAANAPAAGYNSTVPVTAKAPTTKAPVAVNAGNSEITSTVYATISSTVAAPSSAKVSTFEAAAAGMGKSLFAIALIPLVGLF